MKLIHYTDKPFNLEPRKYDHADVYWKNKPRGLWVSVEGEYDWKWWCEAEEFALEDLVVSYEVKLKKDANILLLSIEEEILSLTTKYPFIKPQWDNLKDRRFYEGFEINWTKIAENYQGIIISPYIWPCRLDMRCNWYYGWDCASGCLWDLSCIEEFQLIEVK
jgi:hypothetical protein